MTWLFLLSGFVSEVIGTLAGFGSSTIFLPLALFFFDFKVALVLVAFTHFFGNLGRLGWFKHGWDTKLLLSFGIPSVVCTIVGAALVSYIPSELLKAVLGLFLLIYSLVSIWKENIRLKPTKMNALIGGSLSGFFAGLIGTGGALRGAFLSAVGLTKEKYLATAAAVALLVDITRIPIYLQQGFLPREQYWYVPVLLGVALVGSLVGKKIVDKMKPKVFRLVVLTSLCLIGIKFLYDFFI